MELKNEKELLKQAKAGDVEATETLIEAYKPLARSIARQYFLLGGETEDLLQEGMIGLFQAIQTYEESSSASFKTFAGLLIKRKVQTAIKTANRQKNKMLNYFVPINNQGVIVNTMDKEDDEEKQTGIYIASKLPDPEHIVISKETLAYIKKQIEQKLTELEKKVLQLFIEGNSYLTISKTLNISKKTVDNVLFKVRKKLAYLKER